MCLTMSNHIWNCSQAGALVASMLQGDLIGLGKALSSDKIVEPRRAPLIPGMEAVKKAAIEAGAFGCTISGAGPTAVAVIDSEEKSREIGERMVEAFSKDGNLKSLAMVKKLDRVGARLVGEGDGEALGSKFNGEVHEGNDVALKVGEGDGESLGSKFNGEVHEGNDVALKVE
ncbi:hypothetical protein SASPL_108568 [Salvia splendens]|uniref:GHMP kinase C-terminal domain-containing protein n=1 Tax=Salvia splendens TaxID=180675 RepID=A0A8X9A6R9_SALSN|nr:hypothetical protein SASPL_108568 [Salvia splendens]